MKQVGFFYITATKTTPCWPVEEEVLRSFTEVKVPVPQCISTPFCKSTEVLESKVPQIYMFYIIKISILMNQCTQRCQQSELTYTVSSLLFKHLFKWNNLKSLEEKSPINNSWTFETQQRGQTRPANGLIFNKLYFLSWSILIWKVTWSNQIESNQSNKCSRINSTIFPSER